MASILAKVAFRWMNGVSTHILFIHQYLFGTEDSDAERSLAQVIAQAWNTWKSNLLEEKRLRLILAKVARHWKNRVSTHVLFMHQYLVHDDSDAIVGFVFITRRSSYAPGTAGAPTAWSKNA